MARGKPKDGSKNPGGRPSLYDEKYCDEIIEYFQSFKLLKIDKDIEGSKPVVQAPPSLTKFATKIGVVHDTLLEWRDVHQKFSVALKNAKKIYEDIYVEGAILGHYNAFFTKLVMGNRFDWADKTESKNEHTAPSGIEITFKKSNDSTDKD